MCAVAYEVMNACMACIDCGQIINAVQHIIMCDSWDSYDSHSFSGISTYGRNVSTSLLGPSAAGLGQRDPIDVAIEDAP